MEDIGIKFYFQGYKFIFSIAYIREFNSQFYKNLLFIGKFGHFVPKFTPTIFETNSFV